MVTQQIGLNIINKVILRRSNSTFKQSDNNGQLNAINNFNTVYGRIKRNYRTTGIYDVHNKARS